MSRLDRFLLSSKLISLWKFDNQSISKKSSLRPLSCVVEIGG